MSANHQALTEKEKQTLRLIVRGHDAKSLARHLGLSVHTVNERLRDARRKLEVSSSREAARQLFEREGGAPQSLADKQIGEAAPLAIAENDAPGTARNPTGVVIAGAITMSIVAALFALSLIADQPAPSAVTHASPSPAATVVESDVVRSARDWLVLGDQGRWNDGWLATATSFRNLNSTEQWANAATKVRVPLGALISRTALSQDSVPAPPAGVEVVKFRTAFANKANVVETVSLVREGADWKVVGIYVD